MSFLVVVRIIALVQAQPYRKVLSVPFLFRVLHAHHALPVHHARKRTVWGLPFGNCQRFVAMMSVVRIVSVVSKVGVVANG